MESGSIVAVATAVLSVVSVFLGTKYKKWLDRGRLFAELLGDIVAAEDDAVSEEEFQKIVAAAKQVAADVDEQTATLRKVSG